MKKAVFGLLCVLFAFSGCVSAKAADRKLTEEQEKIAEEVYQICYDNYDEYGVLPSVCLGQAFIESTLGEYCSGYNLWGIASGAESYGSLKEGALRYLKVINNGYYEGAPFEKDRYAQLRKILDGGYCVPEGEYYSNVCWVWRHYDLEKYDKRLWAERKAEKEHKEQERLAKEEEKRLAEEKFREHFKEQFIKTYKSRTKLPIAGASAELFRIMEAELEYEKRYGDFRERLIPQI